MHLYQYLPGKFKATTSPPQKLDALDLTTSTTKSSVLTPKQRNVSVKPRNANLRVKAEAFQKPSPKKETSNKSSLLEDTLPTDVGQGCSDDTVVSDVTTPTTLTYPKIGPGYSDTISVTSDLTIPTVMPGQGQAESEIVQQASVESLLDKKWPEIRPKSAPRHGGSRRKVSFNDGCKTSSSARHSSKTHRSKKEHSRKQRSNSFESDKDLENRLDRLRLKSIEGSSPKSSGRRTSLTASCPARLDLIHGHETMSPSKLSSPKKMEDVLWSTLHQLLENQYCEDFEEEKERSHSSRAERKHRSISPGEMLKRKSASRKHKAPVGVMSRS